MNIEIRARNPLAAFIMLLLAPFALVGVVVLVIVGIIMMVPIIALAMIYDGAQWLVWIARKLKWRLRGYRNFPPTPRPIVRRLLS